MASQTNGSTTQVSSPWPAAHRRQPHRARPDLVPGSQRVDPSRARRGRRRRAARSPTPQLRERVNRLASALRAPRARAPRPRRRAVPQRARRCSSSTTPCRRPAASSSRSTRGSAPPEIRYILEHSGARVLFVDAELIPYAAGRPTGVEVVRVGRRRRRAIPTSACSPTATRTACPRCCSTRRSRSRSTTRRERPGRPKGVVYTYRGAYLNALGEVIEAELGHHPVYLWTLPMFHCNGWCFPWAVTAAGGTHVCLRRSIRRTSGGRSASEGVTHYNGSPTVQAGARQPPGRRAAASGA